MICRFYLKFWLIEFPEEMKINQKLRNSCERNIEGISWINKSAKSW